MIAWILQTWLCRDWFDINDRWMDRGDSFLLRSKKSDAREILEEKMGVT